MTDEGIAILCALYSHLHEPSESEGERLAEYFCGKEEDEAIAPLPDLRDIDPE